MEDRQKIFEEMIQDGYAPTDLSPGNIGKLRRKNVPRHFIQKKTKHGFVDDETSSSTRATSMYGDTKGEPLEAGEPVLIDTDLIINLHEASEQQMDILRGRINLLIRRDNITKKQAQMIFDEYDRICEERKQKQQKAELEKQDEGENR